MRRHRVLWIGLVACLLAPVALYAVLPVAVAAGLQYLLSQQGYQHVTVQLGYPGWRTLQVPLLSFQKAVAGELLAVTVQDSRLEYDLGTLFSGRVHRLTIPSASVSLRAHSGHEAQPCAQPQMATAGPGRLARVTAGHLLHPLPELPWRALVVEQMHVFRECATGPLRDVRISGTLHQTGASAEGAVVFHGTGSTAYRLVFAVSHPGSIEATLQAEPSAPEAIVVVQSHVSQSPAGVQLAGRATTDFAQLAPFLALVLPLGVDLQHVAGTMQATWTATAPPASALATAWQEPATVVSGTVALTLKLPKFAGIGDNLAVRFNGEVTGNAAQLAWTLRQDSRLEVELERTLLPLPATLQWLLPAQDRHVVLECLEPIKGHLRLLDTPLQFTVEGPIRAQYGAARAPLQMEVAFLRMAGQGAEHLTAEGTYRLIGAAKNIPPEVFAVQDMHWNLQGTFALENRRVRGTVETPSFIRLTALRMADVEIPAGTVHLTRPLPLSMDLETWQWAAGPAHADVQTPHVVWKDTTVSIEQAQLTLQTLHGDQARWQTTGMLGLVGVSPQLPTVPFPVTSWQASFAVDDAALRLEATGTAFNEAVTLVSQIEHHFAAQAGSVHLQLSPVAFDPAHVSWRAVLPLQAFPVDVTGGRLAATASLTWGPEVGGLDHGPVLQTGSAVITLDQLSGQYQNILVQGLTTTLHLQTAGADTLTMPAPARVTMAAVQTGVEVTDLSLDLQLGWKSPATLAWVELRHVSAAVLGGRAMSEGLRFDLAALEQAFSVRVEQLDIQQLLHLEQQKGLEGTGLLDGVIPVRLTPTGVRVQDGRLEARPPGGVLRYRPAPETARAVAPSDAPLAQVLQALANFHYHVLQIGVQYVEDGTLHLTARLEGKNPDWQQGRPVHFNLNVEENIPALLKTLRLVQGIEQALEEQLQRR